MSIRTRPRNGAPSPQAPSPPLPPAPPSPPGGLRQVDARMVRGLPGSAEAIEWLRETLAAMQAADPRADVDLGGVEERLAALEAAQLPAGGVELSWLAEVLEEINARLDALEARPEVDLSDILARLEALEAAGPMIMNPLDPRSWEDLDSAKASLLVLITREAARRCGQQVSLYEQMILLDAKAEGRTYDEDLLLLQHETWARERQLVELARLAHNQAIRGLASLAEAVGYDWRHGWPEM